MACTVGRDACRLGALAHDPNGLAGSHGPAGEASQSHRPLDYSSRLSVSEHVERVISEATSIENLSLMYEGWTPWIVSSSFFVVLSLESLAACKSTPKLWERTDSYAGICCWFSDAIEMKIEVWIRSACCEATLECYLEQVWLLDTQESIDSLWFLRKAQACLE
eukprot:COSAG02_NODE_1899_length_10459_cov_5.376544_3_plen_164_part_00